MTDWYFRPYKELTGGGDGALDAEDGSLLKEGDGAVVINNSAVYIYQLVSSNAAESSPNIITPDANGTGKRWELRHQNNNLAGETNWLVRPSAHNNTNNDTYDVYRLPVMMHEVLSRKTTDDQVENCVARTGVSYRGVLANLNNNVAIANGWTKVSFENVAHDTDTIWNANNASRLTVPNGARVVQVQATVVFAANNNGARAVQILQNNNELLGGGRQYVGAVQGGVDTALTAFSAPVQCNNNDYFEVQVYQSSASNLNINAPYTSASMHVLSWHPLQTASKRLLIAQGAYQLYNGGNNNDDSSLEGLANNMAQFSVVCLSHVATYNANGCTDTKYNYLVRLIRAIRNISPTTKIFGYVEGTADAPDGCGYSANSTHNNTGWCNNVSTANVFLSRVANWYNLPAKPDGIFIDLVAPEYLSAAFRDNIYQACKIYGFGMMVNTTYPSYINLAFACNSQYIGHGDYCLIEGYYTAAGNNSVAETNNAVAEFAKYRVKGVRLAALCTEAWANNQNDTVTANNVNNTGALNMFNSTYQRGDVYHYDTADLGIVTKIVQSPAIT